MIGWWCDGDVDVDDDPVRLGSMHCILCIPYYAGMQASAARRNWLRSTLHYYIDHHHYQQGHNKHHFNRQDNLSVLAKHRSMYNRAHRDWPLRPKIENRDSHTWIFKGNWILMWVCFLHFFDLSTFSAAKMRFYFLHFLQGKNAQNRPENPQNWNLAKIGLKSDNFMK